MSRGKIGKQALQQGFSSRSRRLLENLGLKEATVYRSQQTFMKWGRRGEAIFQEKKDFFAFIDLLKDIVDMRNARIAAYCLMTSHYHILIQTTDANLPKGMRHINRVYTQRFNSAHTSDGHLFRGRYKSIPVDADSYLLELVRHIHRNPLEAGYWIDWILIPGVATKVYLSDKKKWRWLHKDHVLKMFSENKVESRKRYRKFILLETPEEINQILSRRKWPSVMGSTDFEDWVRKKFFSKKRHEAVPESKLLAPNTIFSVFFIT